MKESQQSEIKVINYPIIKTKGEHKKFQFSQTRKRPLLDNIEIEIFDEEKTLEIKREKSLQVKQDIANTIEEFYNLFISRTFQECEDELKHLQKSEGWLKSRHYCITASQFGSALGLNPYQNPEQFIQEKLYNKFEGNASTEWGNQHEDDARKLFCEWVYNHLESQGFHDIEFIETNLIKYSDCPWIGVSPDGIIKYSKGEETFWDLIEYKCPSKYKDENPYEKYLLGIPPQYMAQIQGIMGYCNQFSHEYKFTRSWFIVWTPINTYIKEVEYNKEYYDIMYNELQEWYFKKYLPNIFLQYKNIKPKVFL